MKSVVKLGLSALPVLLFATISLADEPLHYSLWTQRQRQLLAQDESAAYAPASAPPPRHSRRIDLESASPVNAVVTELGEWASSWERASGRGLAEGLQGEIAPYIPR